jgi:hypothetical protein
MGLEVLQETAQAEGARALAAVKGILSPAGRLMGENDPGFRPGYLLVASGQDGVDLFRTMIVAGGIAQTAGISGYHPPQTNKSYITPQQGRAMQHQEACLLPEMGHKIFVVHVSGNYDNRRAHSGQSDGGGKGRLPAAAIMQVSAKGYEISINSLQPIQHGPAVVKIRQSYYSQWSIDACHSSSRLLDSPI